jgi:hypothetical protein
MPEEICPFGFGAQCFSVLGSTQIADRPRVVRDIIIPGRREDLGLVVEDGWSGGPETTVRVINVMKSQNMPPLWRRVIGEADSGSKHLVFVEGVFAGDSIKRGPRGAETIFEFPVTTS